MTTSNNDVREFLGIPVEGERYSSWRERNYTPRPISELKPYLDAVWEKGVKAITWQQYTPYFMDGDVCEFSVHEVSVTSNPEVAENWVNFNFHEEYEVDVTKEAYERNAGERWTDYRKSEEDGGKVRYYRELQEGLYDFVNYSHDHPDTPNVKDLDIPLQSVEFEDALRSKFGDHTQVVITPTRVLQEEYSHD